MTKSISIFLAITVSLLGSTACFNPFAPDLSDTVDSVDLIVTNQESPEEVLQNFKTAYTIQDSLLYSGLLDTAFIFVYYETDDFSSGRFVSWGREVDLKTTGSLFRHFDFVDLVWNATIYGWNDDSTGTICKEFQLNCANKESDYRISGRAVFSFRRCQDGRWRITRWKDESEL